MSKVELLSRLRVRLRLVTERAEYARSYQYVIEQEEYSHDREVEHWMQHGKEDELRDEKSWIEGLIDRIDQEGLGEAVTG